MTATDPSQSNLIGRLDPSRPRLAIVQHHGIKRVVTTDHSFAKAAMALEFEVDLFA